jgi:hypothetical protein
MIVIVVCMPWRSSPMLLYMRCGDVFYRWLWLITCVPVASVNQY